MRRRFAAIRNVEKAVEIQCKKRPHDFLEHSKLVAGRISTEAMKDMKNGFDNTEKIVVQIEEELEDLIPGFLASKREDVHSITESLEKGDLEQIRILGHSMKGSGGGYGFDRITEIGKDIEDAVNDKDVDKIRQSNRELADFLERVEVVYK